MSVFMVGGLGHLEPFGNRSNKSVVSNESRIRLMYVGGVQNSRLQVQ